MIQYNLARLRSAPATIAYREGWERMFGKRTRAAKKFLALLPKAQKANAKCKNAWIGRL